MVDPNHRLILSAGDFAATVERGQVRWLLSRGTEVVRGIYGAVRDRDWGTVPPVFDRYETDRRPDVSVVRFNARHRQRQIDFRWEGTISLDEAGRLSMDFDGIAARPFLRRRIGLSLLLPASLEGRAIRVASPWGRTTGELPRLIAGIPPFSAITGFDVGVAKGLEIEVNFEGELFELEDQRNWTDASYKVYGTPDALPAPILVAEGTRVHQRVEVTIRDARRRVAHPRSLAIPLPDAPVRRRPAIGWSTEQGLVKAVHVRSGGHLQVLVRADGDVPLARPNVPRGVELEVVVVGSLNQPRLDHVLEEVLAWRARRLLVVDPESHLSNATLIEATRRLIGGRAHDIEIGGGTRATFAQLNAAFMCGLITDRDIDYLSYGISAQFHSTDDTSVLETVAAHVATIETARKLFPRTPLRLGPISLRHAFNPYAPPRRASPIASDPRSRALLGAAWWVGSLAAAISSELVEAVTYSGFGAPVSGVDSVTPVDLAITAVLALGRRPKASAGIRQDVAMVRLSNAPADSIIVANLRAEDRVVAVALGAAGDVIVSAVDGQPLVEKAVVRRGRVVLPLSANSVVRLDLRP